MGAKQPRNARWAGMSQARSPYSDSASFARASYTRLLALAGRGPPCWALESEAATGPAPGGTSMPY